MTKDIPILLEFYVKLIATVKQAISPEIIDRIISRLNATGHSIELEIERTLDVARPYIFNAYALRSFAADLISSSGGGTTTEEIASQALRIAKEIHEETNSAVDLKDIDERISQDLAFSNGSEFVKMSESLAGEFSRKVSENVQEVDEISVTEEIEGSNRNALLPFLSLFAERIENQEGRKRLKSLIDMEISKIAYLKKSLLGEKGFFNPVMGKSSQLSDSEKVLAMRRISENMGEAGKYLGEENIIVDSLDVAESIDNNFVRSWAYQEIGKVIPDTSVGKYAFEQAFHGAREIQNPALQVVTLTSMAEEYVAVADDSQVRPFIDTIKSAIDGVEDESEKRLSLTNAITAIERMGGRDDDLEREHENAVEKSGVARNKYREFTELSERFKSRVKESDEDTTPSTGLGSAKKRPDEEPSEVVKREDMEQRERAPVRTPMTGMIAAGLRGLQHDTRSMLARLRTVRKADKNHVAILIQGCLNNAVKKVSVSEAHLQSDMRMNRMILQWLGEYGIRNVKEVGTLPHIYQIYQNIRKIEARVMQTQAQETLFLNRYVKVKESISFLQEHITEYEKSIGENPKIYKLESTSLKLLNRQEQAQKKILPSLEKNISNHWKLACKLLIQYEKDPRTNLSSLAEENLSSLEPKHKQTLKRIREHILKLKDLKKMVEEIDKEITASLYKSGTFGRHK